MGTVALLLGLGLGILFSAALLALVRTGILREPSWSAALQRRNPPLRRALAMGVGITGGTVVAASMLLVVDLVYHRPDLWVGQLQRLLVSIGSLAGGALLVLVWLEIAHVRQRRKHSRMGTR